MSNLNNYVGISILEDGVAVSTIKRDDESSSVDICEYRQLTSPDDLREVIESLAQDLDLFGKEAVLVLDPQYYEVFLVEAVDFTEVNKVERLQERVGDLLDFPVANAVLEYVALPEPEQGSASPMGYVIAAQKDKLDEFIGILLDAELNLVAVDVTELILRNIVMLLNEAEQGVLFLYLSPHNKQLLFVKEGAVGMMRSIELDVTGLVPGEGPMNGEGEEASAVRESFIDTVSSEIERSINYCETTLGQSGITQVVVSPTTLDIEDTLPEIAARTSLTVRKMELEEVVNATGEMLAEHQQRCLLAIGAALRQEEVPVE